MMEEFIAHKDYIAAASRLYQYSQNKRYHVSSNEFIKDNIGNIAIYINELIKTKHGLDIFSAKSIENIHKYETMLNNIVSKYTTRRISRRDVSDEAEIIRNSKLVDVNSLKNKTIFISESLKTFLPSFPFKPDELISQCKKPINLVLFQGFSIDSRENYLLTSSIKIGDGASTYYVLIHLSNETGKENSLSILSVFVFSQGSDAEHIENPARLFLECLDEYGLDIEINGKVKKVYGKEKILLSEPFDGNLNFLQVRNTDQNSKYLVSFAIKITKDQSIDMEFVYGVNYTKYFEYLRDVVKSTKS